MAEAKAVAEAAVAEACGINLRAANEQLLNFLQQTMTGPAHTRRDRGIDRERVGKQKEMWPAECATKCGSGIQKSLR